jgi:hypothetical protein
MRSTRLGIKKAGKVILYAPELCIIISINQIGTCHTTKGGWLIHLFKKHLKIEKIK